MARQCGEAGTWTTDSRRLGEGRKKKRGKSGCCLLAFPARDGVSRPSGRQVELLATVSFLFFSFFSSHFENGLNISAIAPEPLWRTLSILLCACLVTKTRPPPGCTSSHE